ncbi:MAG: hypothetical protein IPI67_32890 [Myxococcales bacterium]|nr:hypothetical protein [Myxococcales bacterium]
MSERRVLARGEIRVDARRARAKLREHLLVDLHGYSLELARAAIGFGATTLNVHWDSDDVVFSFDGRPVAPDRLPRLLDFALTETEDENAKALRSLALGVNAALGLGADWVMVTTTDEPAAESARFTPDVFADDDRSSPEPVAARCARPAGAFARGTQVHVRKKLGLEVLRRAVAGGAPREIALLMSHTREAQLVITHDGSPVQREPEPPVLLRAALTLPGAKRAAVEVLSAGGACRVDIMERGVRLLSQAWQPLPGLDSVDGVCAPVRVIIDADQLPTNASRSALREDSPLARELLPAAETAFRKALRALIARQADTPLPTDVEVVTADVSAWQESLGVLVFLCAMAQRAGHEIDPEARALFQAPLFESAADQRITLGRLLSAGVVYVWKDDDPLPRELAPWLADVVWLRGRFAERALEGLRLEDASYLIKRARQGAARRERFLAHAPGPPAVPKSTAELARRRFELTSGTYAGLSGEVALLAPHQAGNPRASLLRVFIEERMLEAVPIEPGFCPLALDAAIAWPQGLRPRFDYDGVERDARLNQALVAVSNVAMGIADSAAARLSELSGSERAALEGVLRDAVAAFSVVSRELGMPAADPTRFRSVYPGLYGANIFPTTAGKQVSLQILMSFAEERRSLCLVGSWQNEVTRAAPDGRPVVVAGPRDAEAIFALMTTKVARVPYERGVSASGANGDTLAGRRAALSQAVADERVRQGLAPRSVELWEEHDGAVVCVAPSLLDASIESHRGVLLSVERLPKSSSCVIVATDHIATVPTPDWDGVHFRTRRNRAAHAQRFTELLVSALEGDATACGQLGVTTRPSTDDPAIGVCLLSSAVSLGARSAKGKRKPSAKSLQAELVARIEALPLLHSFNEQGTPITESIAGAAKHHGETLPVLGASPGMPTLDWRPVLVRSERERELLARRFSRLTNGELELDARRARAAAEYQKRQLLSQVALPLRELGARIAASDTPLHAAARPSDDPLAELEVVIALPRPDLLLEVPWVDLRFAGRSVAGLGPSQVGLPIIANVNSTRAADFAGFAAPTPDGLSRFGARLRLASLELLRSLATEGLLLSDSRALALCLALTDLGEGTEVRALLEASHVHFPTVQGDEAPLSLLTGAPPALWFGSERHTGWYEKKGGASELDQPILFLPPGDIGSQLSALLSRSGRVLKDVSAGVSALQRQRGGVRAAAPQLGGLPPHPSLRASLWELGVTAGDGELELRAGPSSTITAVLLDGRAESFELSSACPFSAVVRVEALELRPIQTRLTHEIEEAAGRVLTRAISSLNHLPAFVRASARAVLCREPSARAQAELATAPVFEDTGGFWHSLGALVAGEKWRFTTLAPPFPRAKSPTLRLSEVEVVGLREGLTLTRVDSEIERALAAEQRRNAPQLASLTLSVQQRAACLLTEIFALGGITGEVGVLSPAHLEQRGGALYVDRRPLCAFDDGDGWPLVCVLNDDSVQPDRHFEAPENRGVLNKLSASARSVARAALERAFAPPATALSSRFLDDTPVGCFRVTGCVWLDRNFPVTPRVRAHIGGQATPMVRAFEAALERSGIGTALPIEGNLLVRVDRESADASLGISLDLASTLGTLGSLTETWEALNRFGEQLAAELLAEARSRGESAPVLEEYSINLAMLGLTTQVPQLRAADGSELTLPEVMAELARRGVLWVSDGRGYADGAFPSGAPPFFLAEGSALVRVIEKRGPADTLRRLGAVSELRAPASPSIESMAESSLPLPSDEALRQSTLEPSWWDRLTAQLSDAFREQELPQATAREHQALMKLLVDFRLTGSPVECVVLGRSQRALRYDKIRKRLLMNAEHPVSLAIAKTIEDDAGVASILAAHALAEVNRALVEVTDSEEQRALLALLNAL